MDEFPKPFGKGSGTIIGYSVEARMIDGCEPKQINTAIPNWCEYITDSKWTKLSFPENSIGVPARRVGHERLKDVSLLDYQAAQALRWWFLAELPSVTGVITRLVKHELKYTYEAIAIKAGAYVEKRENILFDYE